MDVHVLTSYLDGIRSFKGELQGLKKDILCLEDIGEQMRKASGIKGTLFDLQVVSSRLTKQVKEEPTP